MERLLCLCTLVLVARCASFVKRNGSLLLLDGADFHAVGTNIYWLGLDENVPPGTVAYPTEFRIYEALLTAKEMGATVVRAHTLGVSTGNNLSFETGLNTFNSNASITMDYAIATAGELGLKLIIPLTDEYHYYHGGFWNFVSWNHQSDESLFFTDPTIISSFKKYINTLITRTNKVNGLRLVDDPTILAWESGNELHGAPVAWTTEIAQYVKSIDPNHLFLDGTYGINQNALSVPEIDLYSNHYYPMSDKISNDQKLVTNAGKVFFAGEFGWTSGDLNSFLQIIEQQSINNCYWSLFPHRDDYGFVQHSDGFTLHWPGDTSAMTTRATLLRNSAFRQRKLQIPAMSIPPAPLITGASVNGNSVRISWRGAMGSTNYTVQGSPTNSGPWNVICNQCADDNQTPITLNFSGNLKYFRVQGFNLENKAGPFSNVQQAN